MTLTLQDLLTTTDANAPSPAARVVASRAQESRTQHDPFAEFFKNAPNDLDNGASPAAMSDTTTSSQTTSSSSAKADTVDAKSDSDKTNASDNAKADKTTTAKQNHTHSHRKAQKDQTSSDTVANKSTDHTNVQSTNDQNATSTSGTDAATPTNLFQVTLLAAQVYGSSSATSDQTSAKQAVDATNAAAVAATTPVQDAIAGALPMSPADLAALLADQGQAAQPAPTSIPAAITNAQMQAGPNIAILQVPPGVVPKASAASTASQARAGDDRTAKGDAMAQAIGNTPTQTDTSHSEPDNANKGGDQAKDSPTGASPVTATSTLVNSAITLAAAAPINTDSNSSTADNTGATTDVSVTGSNTISPVAAGIATSQQAQALYNQTANRSDSLPQVTIDQVTMRLTKAADDGLDNLTIHLKPAELGTIEVKLEMGNDGISKTTISADRQDTLNLLQKDSHRLEQALQNAGVKTDSSTLSFNLRGDGGNNQMQNFFQQQGGYQPSTPSSSYSARSFDDASLPEVTSIVGYLNTRAAMGGVDIRV